MSESELITFHAASGELAEKLLKAHKAGLRVREITHGDNGYPEPFHGEFFVSGFTTFAEAEAFAEANGGEVGDARWKNGWSCVENFSTARGPLTISGDLANLLGEGEFISTAGAERDFLRDELAAAEQNEDEERAVELKAKIAGLADYADGAIIHMNQGEVFDSYESDEAIRISYDVTNYEIGICLAADDDEDEDEDADA